MIYDTFSNSGSISVAGGTGGLGGAASGTGVAGGNGGNGVTGLIFRYNMAKGVWE